MKTLLAQLKDIPESGRLVVQGPNGEGIILFKEEGRVYALENRCPHMDAPLGEGCVEDGVITCPWHGWQFQIRDGSCLNMPGIDAVSPPISLEGEQIYLLG